MKTPTYLQMEATECGSVCLSIILGYYGYELTPEEARTACGVSRDGSKASHVVRAARQYNLTARGLAIKELSALKEIQHPCILHWNFDHFVVYEGKKGGHYILNDPATGRRKVDHEEFNSKFTGVVLELTPGPDFKKRALRSSLLSFFRMALKRGSLGIFTAFVLGVLQVLPSIFMAISGKIFIDYILIKNMTHWLPKLIILILIGIVVQSLLMAISQRLLTRLSVHFRLSLASMIVHKLFYLPLRFFDQRFSGDILYRLSTTEQLTSLLSLDIMGALSNIFGIAVFSCVLYWLSWPLFFTMMGFVALRSVVFLVTRERVKESNIHYEQQSGKVSGIEMNGLDMMETLKANNLESVFQNNWMANHDLLMNKQQIVNQVAQRISIWMTTLAGLMNIGLLYQGTYLVMQGDLTIGTLMAFMALSVYLDGPVMTLIGFLGQLEKVKASISRFNDVIDYEANDMKKSPVPLPSLESSVSLENITFAYAPLDPPILKNLTITIPKGETIAIVGSSGSGKSTISKLICGLYPLTSGRILWDQEPLNDCPLEQRNQHIALVDQDIFLFEGTVRDNLTSWQKNLTDDELIAALKDVSLYDELLPRGLLNSYISENGQNLSGGQRQRLEIARALLRKTDLLILDEASSALDVGNEQHIYNALGERGVSTLLIAHRLSTIKQASMIYVLQNGEVVQQGPHAELANVPGLYQNLVALEEGTR